MTADGHADSDDALDRDLRAGLALWRELMRLSWRQSKVLYCTVIGALVLDTCAIALIGVGLRAIVSGSVDHSDTAVVVGALGAALAYTVNLCIGEIGAMMRIELAEVVAMRRILPEVQRSAIGIETIEHLERADYLDRLAVVEDNSWGVVDSAWAAVESVGFTARLALTLGLLGSVSPLLFTVLAAGAIPVVFERRSRMGVKAAELARSADRRLQRELFELAVSPAAGKELRVAGAGRELVRRQRAAADRADAVWIRARIRAALWAAAGWCLFSLSFVGGLAVVVHGAASDPARIGDIVLTVTVGSQLRMIVEQAVRRSADTGGYGRLLRPFRWLRRYRADQLALADTTAGRRPPTRLASGITFDRVTFRYPGTDRAALDELTVHLPPGSVVAVVGEYGSGKTTLVKLLTKLYRPDRGRILIDGTDLADLDTSAWRAATSAAFQDFGRYHVRVAEAVGLGDVTAMDDEGRIRRALADADADAFVGRLPDGPRTRLGHQFGGVEISEGQWQKIALARASMRRAPLLFVLDEPTASLDAPSEHAIFARYMHRAKDISERSGGITLVVSHRFSTVAGADLILVMADGKLVESGTHEQLLAADARYAALYSLQATAYAG
jgi:ATP-binding cassette, subfamily B, bacterial